MSMHPEPESVWKVQPQTLMSTEAFLSRATSGEYPKRGLAFREMPQTSQFVVWTIHFTSTNNRGDVSIAPAVAYFACQNPPRKVESWQDLSDLVQGYCVEGVDVWGDYGSTVVVTAHRMKLAIEGKVYPASEWLERVDDSSGTHPARNPNTQNVFWEGWNIPGKQEGLKFFGLRWQFVHTLNPIFRPQTNWPEYMAKAFEQESEPDDFLNVRVYIHATTSHPKMRESRGWICNTGKIESVWCARETESQFVVQIDPTDTTVLRVRCAKFWRRIEANTVYTVVLPGGKEVEKVRFIRPISPLFAGAKRLEVLGHKIQAYANSGAKPEHALSYWKQYEQYRDQKMPRGVAKRRALAERRITDLNVVEWVEYLGYQSDPEGYFTTFEQRIAEARAAAEKDQARLEVEARSQWEDTVQKPFLARWSHAVRS